MTVIRDQVKAQALNYEIDALLAKAAIVPVNPLRDPGGFYSKYFLVPKKTAALYPLQVKGLKILPYLDDWLICATNTSSGSCGHTDGARSHRSIGSSCELGEEQLNSLSGSHVPGNYYELPHHAGLPIATACQWDSTDVARLPAQPYVAQQPAAGSDLCSAPTQEVAGVPSMPRFTGSVNLLLWAAPFFASLRAAHIPGVRNGPADFLSRGHPPPGEWRLHPEVVRVIWERYGMAPVDLFASQETTHCPLWFSRAGSASPLGQNTLAHNWSRVLLYAFPPLPLIDPTLLRVLQEGYQVLLVAPIWPGRTWFPLLHRLCCSSPMPLPHMKDLLSQLRGQLLHPDPSRLRLWAWPL
ncbi:uncharacterized protein LOC119414894 [Nematolebias whitei]|uniref:uncharacterized protein LOC119414894 n=1 Tax=Nematolebias whitei TaxID=451745 RepID=UPI00189B9EF6|nr:uncharacterized protein LOC119414894 [Nematolebias whitei]